MLLSRRLDTLTIREVDGELLILDVAANRIHQLNRTATLIWQRCESDTAEGIASQIAERFEIDKETALADVRHTIESFRSAGLVAQT